MEVPKSKIFIALKNGELKAMGMQHGFLKKNSLQKQWLNDDCWEYGEEYPEFSQIPPNHWRFEGIVWNESSARSTESEYARIIVNTEDLFTVFPELAVKIIPTKSVMGSFVIDETRLSELGKKAKSQAGRPSYDWNTFNGVLVEKLLQGQLPKKLETLVYDMQDWCKDNWNCKPARSTLIEKISPIYNAFKSEITRK